LSLETKEIFKQQILNEKLKSKRKLKVKKLSNWIIPTAYYRQYRKIILIILNKYIAITESIFPLLENWNKEVKSIKNDVYMMPMSSLDRIWNTKEEDEAWKYLQNDAWEEELENINVNEYEKVFEEEKDSLKRTLLSMGVLISLFNRNQWTKIVNQQFNFEPFIYEKWENSILNFWVNRNVNLIKGLTDEYRKKIVDTILSENAKGLSVSELQTKLKSINKTFSDYRTNLIAKDQINKINNQLAEQRMRDAGIETYIWITSKDERVRPSHAVMENKLCRLDDPSLYSDDNGRTWKSRSSIGGVQLPPGEDINCRCTSYANFESLVNEINKTSENILG